MSVIDISNLEITNVTILLGACGGRQEGVFGSAQNSLTKVYSPKLLALREGGGGKFKKTAWSAKRGFLN